MHLPLSRQLLYTSITQQEQIVSDSLEAPAHEHVLGYLAYLGKAGFHLHMLLPCTVAQQQDNMNLSIRSIKTTTHLHVCTYATKPLPVTLPVIHSDSNKTHATIPSHTL